MGDKIDVFIPLNQDTMDRHLHLLKAGACAIFDNEKITPGQAADALAFIFSQNKWPAGQSELPPDVAALKQIQIPAK